MVEKATIFKCDCSLFVSSSDSKRDFSTQNYLNRKKSRLIFLVQLNGK